jgi:hypothetical protein
MNKRVHDLDLRMHACGFEASVEPAMRDGTLAASDKGENVMTRRWFVMACCVLVSATSMLAQSRGTKAKADPLSGTWTGALVLADASRTLPITMELKFDGSVVSGTVSGLPNPADVKAGTFDPKKGALKLRLGKKGDGAVLLVLEGTVAKDTATGRFSGDESGEFKITKKTVKPAAR